MSDKADGFARGGRFQKGSVFRGSEETAVGIKPESLLGAPHGDLRKVRAAGLDSLVQVEYAGTLQGLLENLIAEGIEDSDLYRRGTALRIRKDAVVDAYVPDGVIEG